MLRGGHNGRGGRSPHRPSKKPDPVLPANSTYGCFQTLPQEIRDVIYDLISQPKDEEHDGYHFRTRTVVPHARLLSKQFTREYDECPPRNTDLRVTQYRCSESGFRQLQGPIPSMPAQTEYMHFDLLVCEDPPWVRSTSIGQHDCFNDHSAGALKAVLQNKHGRFIHSLISVMPVLKEVSITISCGNMECAVALQSSHQFWKNTPYLSRLVLLSPTFGYDLWVLCNLWDCYYLDGDRKELHPSTFFENRQTMATWTSVRGWEINNDLTEKCREEESKVVDWILPYGQ
jgi:hypothetical protein